MKTLTRSVVAAACGSLFVASAANAGINLTILGVEDIGATTSRLFSLDLSNGDFQWLSSTFPNADVEGLAPTSATTAFTVTGERGASGHDFQTVDFGAGSITSNTAGMGIDLGSGNNEVTGMATAMGTGVHWGFIEGKGWATFQADGSHTVAFNRTGEINGVAATDDGSILYGVAGTQVVQLDTMTGIETPLVDLGGSVLSNDIENLELLSDGVIAGVTDSGGVVQFFTYDINTQTFNSTTFDNLPISDVETFMFNVPAPSAAAILALATPAAVRRRRN